jgi:hypothetical protein
MSELCAEVKHLLECGDYSTAATTLLITPVTPDNIIQVRLLMKIIIITFGRSLGPLEHKLTRRVTQLQ